VSSSFPSPAQAEQSTDELLGKAFAEIENNRLDLALDHIEALLRAKPDFRPVQHDEEAPIPDQRRRQVAHHLRGRSLTV